MKLIAMNILEPIKMEHSTDRMKYAYYPTLDNWIVRVKKKMMKS